MADATTRGTCAACGRDIFLHANGTLRRHSINLLKRSPACQGSGSLPAPAKTNDDHTGATMTADATTTSARPDPREQTARDRVGQLVNDAYGAAGSAVGYDALVMATAADAICTALLDVAAAIRETGRD